MKVFLKVISIILIVLGAFGVIGSIFTGAISDIFTTLFGAFGVIFVIFNCTSSILTLGSGICGCNFVKIPKVCYILGIILGIVNLIIIGINLFVFHSSFANITLLIVNFVLAVLYLIPVIKLRREV